jgi:hypothetical protein
MQRQTMLFNSVENTKKINISIYEILIEFNETSPQNITDSVMICHKSKGKHYAFHGIDSDVNEILDIVHISYEGSIKADRFYNEENGTDIFINHPHKYVGVYAVLSKKNIEIYNATVESGYFFNTYKKDKVLTIHIQETAFEMDIPYSDPSFIEHTIPFTSFDLEEAKKNLKVYLLKEPL